MAYNPQRLKKAFYSFSEIFKRQTGFGTPLADADLDTRHNCTVEFEDVVETETIYDCSDEDIFDEEVLSQLKRVTITYSTITPQILFGWIAGLLGAVTAPTGNSANEVQTLTRNGTVSSGDFDLELEFEGKTFTADDIPYNSTQSQIESALIAAGFNPGDVTVESGVQQIETLTIGGTANESEDLEFVVTADGMPNSPKTLQVAIADTDTAAIAAGKARAAMIADPDIGHPTTGFFEISGAAADVVFTAKTAAANDGTMAITYENAHGMTGGTSANTQAGVAINDWSGGMRLNFDGTYAKTEMPLFNVNSAGITGGGTVEIAETVKGGNNYHAATRSTDDKLPKFCMGSGYEGNTTNPKKYRDLVVESVSTVGNRRGNVTATVVLLGRFTPASMAAYDIPDCANLPALKGRDCKIKVNGVYLHEEFWSGTATFSNATPTGEDAFPFDDIEVGDLERGDRPTYPIGLQILGSEGDTIGEICRLRQKVPVEFHYGKPGNRASVILPNVQFKFASNPRTFVGERNRSAHNIDAVPHKDAVLKTPLRAEAYLDQATAFLST
ncbi:MAG: hypothetical protein KF855_03845 [Acidobacteria bacterium]|nr:hypothetical protein [Acidobacteriota bacterium]